MTAYDGRYSDDCKTGCADGTCWGAGSSEGCGGCCGCLGGCRLGFEEQCEEEAKRGRDAS